jgi:hypothetical protein
MKPFSSFMPSRNSEILPMSTVKSNADIEPCLAVVMPAYNEAADVADIVKEVIAQPPDLK